MEGEDTSWVYDSLICFLNGPVWNAPLQTFIEEKSLIFEPNKRDCAEYKEVFEQFKNMVDLLLGSYMEDIGISPDQFEDACCNQIPASLLHNNHQHLFELIYAANNYDRFKRMMTQRNVELQLQALELIEEKFGITPQSFIPEKSQSKPGTPTVKITSDNSPESDEVIMEEVKKQVASEEDSDNVVDDDKQQIEEEKVMLQKTLATVKEERRTPTPKPSAPPPPSLDKPPIEVDHLEIKKRQEYLKAQRDKLVALKKQVRKKHLQVETETQKDIKARPRSAKVAEAALTGEINIEPHTLEIRKALAEKLRAEVVDGN